MKQMLHFLSEQEFQNFCSQLFSAEFTSYQAVEGAGGDGGLDGIDRTVAFQMYFPEIKNRKDSSYISKIDDTLSKLKKLIEKEELEITQWVFVVPEDIRYKVAIHLQKKARELGIECVSWGASKLTELVIKHPHIRNSFPGIFLPDVKEGLSNIKEGLLTLSRPRSLNIEIITDKEFRELDQAISDEYKQKASGEVQRFGTSSSAHIAASEIHRQEANKKKKELRMKKEASDRAYELEKQDIEDQFAEIIDRVRESFAIRGLNGSGIEARSTGRAEVKKSRELEKLKLKYGKEN